MERLVKVLRVAMLLVVLAGMFLVGALLAGIAGGVGVAFLGWLSGLPQAAAAHVSASYEH